MISSAKALKIIGLITLLSVSFWFIFILFLAIKAPVSWGDEALHGEIIKRLFNNQPVYPPFDITLFGRHLPLTTDMKHGVVEIYLLAPFMYLGGMTIEALRSGYIFWVVITLLITYYFCFSLFSFAVANLALILLAVNFPYFDYSHLGTTFGLTLPFFVMSSLIFLFKWEQRRNNLYLYLAFFFLALGFQVKGWFIYFILALFICSFFFHSYWQKVSLRIKITAAFVFSIALLPFILFYFKSNLTSFVVLNAAKTSTGKINNLNVFSNLLTRLDHLAGIVSGSNDGISFLRIFPFLLFCLAFIFLIRLVLSKRLTIHSGKGVGFILLVFFFTFSLSVFTLTFLRQGHLIILFPLAQIILALAIVEAWKLSTNALFKALVVLLTLIFIFFNVINYFAGYRDFKNTVKEDSQSGIPVLTQWLLKEGITKVRGFYFPVVCGIEFFGYPRIDTAAFKFYSDINPAMVEDSLNSEVFVFSLPYDIRKLESFKSYAKGFVKKPVLLKRFNYSDGQERFLIYRLD